MEGMRESGFQNRQYAVGRRLAPSFALVFVDALIDGEKAPRSTLRASRFGWGVGDLLVPRPDISGGEPFYGVPTELGSIRRSIATDVVCTAFRCALYHRM